jgi:hypothetical protein
MLYPQTEPTEGNDYLILEIYTLDDSISRVEKRQNWDTGEIYCVRNGGLDTDQAVNITLAQYEAMSSTGTKLPGM